MKWTEIYNIAIALEEKFPNVEIASIRFTQLQKDILSLDGFDDDVKKCNEKILEAIQQAWLDER